MKRILFIINPISGGKSKRGLKASLDNFRISEYPGHASILAKQSQDEIIVAVGGDGTVNEVARGIIGTPKILGIVPMGSGNGLVRHLGINLNYNEALYGIKNGNIIEMY